MIRPITIHDLKCLEDSAMFPMPNVNNPLYFYQIAVEDEEGLVGIALVKLTTETVLILDKEASRLRKARAIREIWEPIEKVHIEKELEDTHAFLLHEDSGENEYFARLLMRQGFVDAMGIPLYYVAGRRNEIKCQKVQAGKREQQQQICKQVPQQLQLQIFTEQEIAPLVPAD